MHFISREWGYLDEGGRHLLLRYYGDDDSLKGSVVRLRKRSSAEIDNSLSDCNLSAYLEIEYSKCVVKPWLGDRYLCSSIVLEIPESEMEQLVIQIQDARESTRWKKSLIGHETLLRRGQLMKDLSVFTRPFPFNSIIHQNSFLSWEFKVKSNINSTSAFLPEDRLLKRLFGTFQITQLSKLQNPLHLTNYNPRDLCSRNSHRIKHAIHSLLHKPAINLKICFNGTKIYGDESNDFIGLQNILDQYLSLNHSNHTLHNQNSIDFITDIISRIFCEEDILQRLELMEALGPFGIDIEGSKFVYDHLVRLVGSEEDVIAKLRQYVTMPINIAYCRHLYDKRVDSSLEDEFFALNNNHSSILESKYSECSSILSAEDEELLLSVLTTLHVSDDASVEDRAIFRIRAQEWAQTLTDNQCIYLLRMWLLSLAASDASIIMCMQCVTDSQEISDSEIVTDNSLKIKNCINPVTDLFSLSKTNLCLKQSDHRAGEFHFHSDQDTVSKIIYTISVIDIGPKPPTKIMERFVQDGVRIQQAITVLSVNST